MRSNYDVCRYIVVYSESMEQLEKTVERWRYALEGTGMKVSRSKSENMCD